MRLTTQLRTYCAHSLELFLHAFSFFLLIILTGWYICTVTPAAIHQEETLSTIKFATRAKNIKNKPVINEVMNEATMMRKLKDEIHTLKNQLAQRV
jgi:hypothetical protein